MDWQPPQPKYIAPREFGCDSCRNAVNYGPTGSSEISKILVSAEESLGQNLLEWTKSFQVCQSCDAIWAVSYNPKDMVYDLTATPDGMINALLPKACLDDIMVPLFAWAPIDEMTEHALWVMEYDPQKLYDMLVAAWRSPKTDTARRADILRQLERLVTCKNKYHKQRHQQTGWLLVDDRGFTQELEEINPTDGIWKGHSYAADERMTILSKLSGEGVLQSRPEIKSTQSAAHKKAKNYNQRVNPTSHTQQSQPVTNVTYTEVPSLRQRVVELLMPAWRFLPAVFVAGFIEYLVSQMPPKHQMGGYSLLSFVLILNGVAVMANSQITELSFGRLVWNRLSAIGDYLLFLVLYIISAVIGFGVAGFLGFDASDASVTWTVLLAVLMLVVLQVRFWPFWIIPYMQSVERDIPSHDMLGNTKETSLVSAWKLTKHEGPFLIESLVWFSAIGLSIALLFITNQLAGQWGLGLALYAMVLPFMTALTWALVEQLGFEAC